MKERKKRKLAEEQVASLKATIAKSSESSIDNEVQEVAVSSARYEPDQIELADLKRTVRLQGREITRMRLALEARHRTIKQLKEELMK